MISIDKGQFKLIEAVINEFLSLLSRKSNEVLIVTSIIFITQLFFSKLFVIHQISSVFLSASFLVILTSSRAIGLESVEKQSEERILYWKEIVVFIIVFSCWSLLTIALLIASIELLVLIGFHILSSHIILAILSGFIFVISIAIQIYIEKEIINKSLIKNKNNLNGKESAMSLKIPFLHVSFCFLVVFIGLILVRVNSIMTTLLDLHVVIYIIIHHLILFVFVCFPTTIIYITISEGLAIGTKSEESI